MAKHRTTLSRKQVKDLVDNTVGRSDRTAPMHQNGMEANHAAVLAHQSAPTTAPADDDRRPNRQFDAINNAQAFKQ